MSVSGELRDLVAVHAVLAPLFGGTGQYRRPFLRLRRKPHISCAFLSRDFRVALLSCREVSKSCSGTRGRSGIASVPIDIFSRLP